MDDHVPEGRGEPDRRANPGYAHEQLRRALSSAISSPDAAVRRRAEEKVLAWEAVLDGMASGRLSVGSRTPVAGVPPWVTLEVAHGGFATGALLAERPLDADELALLAQLPDDDRSELTDRFRLNRWFLSDAGLATLDAALRSGDYVVDLPEHAALLTVTWLLAHGHGDAALDLVAELFPLMPRLRFSPRLGPVVSASTAIARLETVGEVRDRLAQVSVPPQVAAMNETLSVWHPLYDRLVELWSSTVVDGWPCASWPDDWSVRRSAWLDDYAEARATHRLAHEHARPRSTFSILRRALDQCEHDSSALTGRDVGLVRMALARSVDRWGLPGSDQRDSLRAAQLAHAARPTNEQVARALDVRLADLPADQGLLDLRLVSDPVHVAGTRVDIPSTIARKARRAFEAPIEDLVAERVVTSSEVLAQLVPQITAHVAAGSFDDPHLRQLYARAYAAFRRRRSLLLLNLEHQVRIHELPWVRAVEPLKLASLGTRQTAIDTVRDLTALAITSFPQTVLPNPLLTEIGALTKQAEIGVPIVEEVAADIFMGTFTPKWRRAAALAAAQLEGTLYARYYGLPPATRWPELASSTRSARLTRITQRLGRPVDDDFAEVCAQRAKEAHHGDGSWVARNGAVIEQSQILTTHNLATLVAALDLRERVEPRAGELAERCLRWVAKQQATAPTDRRAELQMLKNTAYAWRQAIFFLSLLDPAHQRAVAAELRAAADGHGGTWRARFEPVIVGLEAAIAGRTFDERGVIGGGRRFLGWSVGPHWLAAPEHARHRRI